MRHARARDIADIMRAMADVDGACARLKRALRRAKFPRSRAGTRIDTELKRGDGKTFVAILRHALCARSKPVSRRVYDRGHDLVGVESPLRFTERAFRATIDVFGYKPKLSASQFASTNGFAVVKMMTVIDVLAHVEAMEVNIEREVAREASRRRTSGGLTGSLLDAGPRRRSALEPRFARGRVEDERGVDESNDAHAHTFCDTDNWVTRLGDEYDDVVYEAPIRGVVYTNPGYVVHRRARSPREPVFDASVSIDSLRVEFAEVLGRLTRVENELTEVAARCLKLERREAQTLKKVDRAPAASRDASPSILSDSVEIRQADSPSKESTEEFIARYLRKLRDVVREEETRFDC